MPKISVVITSVVLTVFCYYGVNCSAAVLIQDGKTSLTIYHDKGVPSSVENAAEELRHYIKKVSGADISITTKIPAGKFISLGVNQLSRQAGLSLNKVKADGYLIAIKNDNIYILGRDTQDSKVSTECGFSKGTLFGTYTFIEKYLGVRWFMPGSTGEYYNPQSNIELKPAMLVENPDFRWRNIPYLTKNRKLDGAMVKQWLLRQKINLQAYRMSLIHYHVWHRVFTADLYKKHPEYFALLGGKRMPPIGDRYKICTSNPGAIKFMAQAAIKFFAEHPQQKGYSLSPTDSAGYCQCAKCTAQDEVDSPPNGKLTRRILLFYNAVAKIVAKKYPDRFLCGYIYSNYLYPPKDRSIKTSPNLFLVVASSLTYGYTFFRPEVQQEWNKIMQSWCSMTTNIAYYDLPNHSSENNGAPLAPGIEILGKMLPALKKFQFKALYIYGDPEWGHAVVYNYLLAKMMWNAELDVDQHLSEFYRKCYGAGGADIRKIYGLIDAKMKSYYLENHNASYTLTTDILKQVYVANLKALENFYFTALGKVKAPAAKRRVEMLGDNLKVMYYFCRSFGLIGKKDKSRFAMTDIAFKAFAKANKDAFYLPKIGDNDSVPIKDLRAVAVKPRHAGKNADKISFFYLRDGVELMMQAQNDNVIEIDFRRVKVRGKMISYLVVNSTGKKIISGTVAKDAKVRFNGSNGEVYQMFIKTHSTSYNIKLSDIPYAVFAGKGKGNSRGLHFLGRTTPIYFYVGDKVNDFTLTMSSSSRPGSKSGGETADGELYDPNGKLVRKFSTLLVTVDAQTIKNPQPGIWKYKMFKAGKGYFDDVYVVITGPDMSGFVALDPENILSVSTE
ncbi:MAG: DUF4838 domain-containing protein [Victivallaceae bacterium]|nr:DUF4838 domain-containing protein [Victivallaceae bacterium]